MGPNHWLRPPNWRPGAGTGTGQETPTSLNRYKSSPIIGWGDSYFQEVAGQSFGITQLPNGVRHIEVVANPDRALHETSTRNDVALRKVILGGTPGHRTVRVPAWHGLDPEG
jgi:hypothetical protein